MSKFYSGQDGKMFIERENVNIQAADELAKVRSWSFTVNTSVLETVSLGDFDRTIIPGITSITGSASIYYYAEATNAAHNSGLLSTRIIDTILPRSGNFGVSRERQKVRFRLESDPFHRIDIKAVITSFNMTKSVGEVMAADITFEGDGVPLTTFY